MKVESISLEEYEKHHWKCTHCWINPADEIWYYKYGKVKMCDVCAPKFKSFYKKFRGFGQSY